MSEPKVVTCSQFSDEIAKSIVSELPKKSFASLMLEEAKTFGENLFCFDAVMSEYYARICKQHILNDVRMVCEQLNMRVESVSNGTSLLTKEHGEIANSRHNKLLVTFKPA